MTIRLDGRKLADELQTALQKEVAASPFTPKLVVLLVGENPASEIYVRNKKIAAEKVGFHSVIERFPQDITEEVLLQRIQALNEDETTDGILVQLPLPKQMDEEKILLAIDPKKDVDGFHPKNLGLLLAGKPEMIPATPFGIMSLLKAYEIPLAGKVAVVIGRSNIVGKPMAQLLLQEDATVIMTHSKTSDLQKFTQMADILIVAIGKGNFITKDYVKPGAVVIDVGMNRKADGKLTGDVDFQDVYEKVSYITPVPKGVGPMTITSLLQQTFYAAKKRRGK